MRTSGRIDYMTLEHTPVRKLENLQRNELRYFPPKQVAGFVELMFAGKKGVMHDSYEVDGGELKQMSSEHITDFQAHVEHQMVDWNTETGTGYISMDSPLLVGLTAENDTPILKVAEERGGKVVTIHRFWNEN